MTVKELDPRLIRDEPGIAGAAKGLRRRLGQGELGSLPVVLGLAAVWIYFQVSNSNFLSAGNLTNLMLQITAMGTIAVGVVLVLLLGEIDLSVGAVSGLAGGVMAVENVNHGVGGNVAIVLALLTGAAVGVIHGLWITKLRVPSFVVTLAGLLAWQGALLHVLGKTGTVNITDHSITRLTGTFYSDGVSWTIAVIALVLYVGYSYLDRRRRTAAGLMVTPMRNFATRMVWGVAGVIIATAVFTSDRGLPLAVLIFVGLVAVFDLILKRTRFGRHVYAVGGNAEAARRAGIRVEGIRLTVFILGSTLAAAGGVLAASRLLAVNQSSGAGDLLLTAIASAVIGGTSLFGGRGSAWSALLGALVIGSISNGMDLLGKSSEVKFMVTGAALLVAATIDAVARRGRQAAGRA
jgi:D-xylose transport system permease protein